MFSCLFKMQVIQLCFIVKKKGGLIFYLFSFFSKRRLGLLAGYRFLFCSLWHWQEVAVPPV